jgi:hypothetical protein
MRENGKVRVLADKTVESYAEAESVAKAFSLQHNVAWDQVEVISG